MCVGRVGERAARAAGGFTRGPGDPAGVARPRRLHRGPDRGRRTDTPARCFARRQKEGWSICQSSNT